MTACPIEYNFDASRTHDYEIREAVDQRKHSIAAEAQQLTQAACILQQGVEVSWQSGLVTNQAKHKPTSIEQPPNKYQKSLQCDRAQSAKSIKAVQNSYRSAIRNGRLKYNREPQSVSSSDGSRKAWDPYILPKALINRAILDKQKVEEAIQKVETIVQIVPKADEWMTKTQEYRLTPKDVERTLQRAFVSPEPFLEPLPEQDEVRPILGIAANALRRAREFRAKDGTFEREETLLRMVAYASIEVSIVVEEATVEQVELLMKPLAAGGRDWLARSRSLVRFWCWAMANSSPWEGRDLPLLFMLLKPRGESALRELFQATFPVNAGEFVSTLSSEVYWKDLPALTRIPSLIEIVMVLLGDYVERETIGSALGCPASYMKGLDPNLFSAVCTQAMTLYKPKLFWKEATGETGQEDQTKEGMSMRDEFEDITDHERVDFHSLFGDIFIQA